MSESFSQPAIPRRAFLKSTGSLAIGFSLLGWNGSLAAGAHAGEDLPGSLRRFPRINAWIEVLPDGFVRIFSGKVELGQGIRIAIRQVAAEELDMDLDRVEVVLAETGRTPDEGYTAGSGSIQSSAMAVRYAAAAAREKLLALAAGKLQVPLDRLALDNGTIRTTDGSRSLTFAEILAGQQIEDEVQLPVALKPKEAYRYVGKAIPREDIGAMVRGGGLLIHDLRFPDMVHARVLRPKNYQSELIRLDEAGLKAAVPGLLKVVKNGRFLAVITKTEHEAAQALKALARYSEWSSPAIFPPQAVLPAHLKRIAEAPKTVAEKGTMDAKNAKTTLRGAFFKPYTLHAAMGPACALALFDGDILHVWSHSQGIYPMREALKAMLGMDSDHIHVISVPGAGCFGHTVADDAAADAALLAMAYPHRHIRVQWSRQDEHAWEPYGSAMIMELEAGLDAAGKIHSWRADVWTDSHSTRPNKDAGTVLAARHIDPPLPMQSRGYLAGGHRNADPYYDIPNLRVDAHFFDGPLRVSSLRSLGAYANIFAIESLMDQLADAAGQDPLAFRLAHLSDARARAVIEKVRDMTADSDVQTQEGIGYAFCRYKNTASYCALAAKVGVDLSAGTLQLLHLWAAVDVGEVINADGIRNQVEGGLIQAASWTLKEAVTFDDHQITSLDWATYPIFRMEDTPVVEVAILDRPSEPAMGGGEVSMPPVAAAIANAVFRACGRRVYELPIRLG